MTPAGDTTRSDFLYSQLTIGDVHLFAADRAWLGEPARSTATSRTTLQQFLSLQANASTQATAAPAGPERRGQRRCRQKFNSTSSVNLELGDVEPDPASECLCRQCPRHVGGAEHDDHACSRLKRKAIRTLNMSISSINYGLLRSSASQVRNINQQLTDLSTQLSTGKLSHELCRHGRPTRALRSPRARNCPNIAAYHRHDDQRQRQYQPRQHRAAVAGARSGTTVQNGARPTRRRRSTATARRWRRTPRPPSSARCSASSTPRRAIATCSPAPPSTRRRSPSPDDIINGTTTQAGLEDRHGGAPGRPTSAPTAWGGWCITQPTPTLGAGGRGCRRHRRSG